jgi:hypothetical protein
MGRPKKKAVEKTSVKKIVLNGREFQLMGVDSLVKAEWNYKDENEYVSKKLVRSIKKSGFLVNMVVRELDTGYFEVVDGNHRHDAVIEAGLKEVLVCNLGKVSVEEAKRQAVQINETRYRADFLKLSDVMKDLEIEFGKDDLMETMPFTEDEYKGLIELDLPPSLKNSVDDGDKKGGGRMAIKFFFSEPELDVWTAYKNLIGVTNDTEALMQCVQSQKQEHEENEEDES